MEFVTLVDAFMPSIRLAEETKLENRIVILPVWLNSLAKANKINFSKVFQEALEVKLNCRRLLR